MQPPLIGMTCSVAMLLSGAALKPDGHDPAPRDSRAVVARALPYLARQAGAWIEEKKCTSCHQVPHALWAMNEARTAGLDVDHRLTEWNRWSVSFVLREGEESEGEETRARERADEAYQMLLSGAVADVESDAEANGGSADAGKELVSLLLMGRHPDGMWHAGGQLPGQKRPEQETNEATTLWCLYTLRSNGNKGEDVEAARQSAKAKLEVPSTTIEHLVLRYLLALDEADSAEAAALQNQILSQQNSDGGWSWLLKGGSDALATGQVMYALSYMKPERRREAVQRAHGFLARTQQADGSWQVPSTLRRNEDQPSVVSNDWGTAWAVIGLMRTMER